MSSLTNIHFTELAYGITLADETAQRINAGMQSILAVAAPALMQAVVPLDGFADAQDE